MADRRRALGRGMRALDDLGVEQYYNAHDLASELQDADVDLVELASALDAASSGDRKSLAFLLDETERVLKARPARDRDALTRRTKLVSVLNALFAAEDLGLDSVVANWLANERERKKDRTGSPRDRWLNQFN